MNKKAGQRVLILYWIFIMVIILVGVVSGVLAVYGANIDVREAEAGLLRDRVVGCLVSNGELNKNVFDSTDLLSNCNINLEDNTEKYAGTEQYAISLSLDGDKKEFGKQALFVECERGEAKCLETKIYVSDNGEKFLTIKTAVDKNEKNE